MTGAAAGLGRALVERLASREDLGGLLGIDTEQVRIDGVVWRTAEPRDPLLATRLAGASTVVHLATSYDLTMAAEGRCALNVRGTALLLEAAPLRGEPDPGTLADDHTEIERLVEGAGMDVTVLRPATLVGLPSEYDGQLLRQLSAPRLLAVRGHEPLWQLCHRDDLLSALELAALGRVSGGLAVGCDGAMKQLVVEGLSGRRRLELPASVALSTAERLHRLGVTTSSPRELDHLLGPLVVASDGLRAAGWEPVWTNEAALRAHLLVRSGDGRAGAYTAAGATVALLGSAALVRRARRRRHLR